MRTALLAGVSALALLAAPAAFASHQFTDVPDTNPFHTEIGIFKNTNITTGCTATTFCPADYVRRQAMAAFIDRALGLVVRPGETTQTGVPGSRVWILDDESSFVGTQGNALEYRGPSDNVVGGGLSNFADPPNVSGGTVAGGLDNGVTGDKGAVGGGLSNRAARLATVPGGHSNVASAESSFAAGRYASADDANSFLWNDGTFELNGGRVYSPEANSFAAHANGGFHFWTNTAFPNTTGCWIPAGGGSWTCSSDRNVKENFRPVDSRRLLDEVAKLPITSWNYKGQKDRFRHLGPTSQDFRAAFGVGENDKTIAMVDADGVALAAIQALARANRSLRREVRLLRASVAELKEDRR